MHTASDRWLGRVPMGTGAGLTVGHDEKKGDSAEKGEGWWGCGWKAQNGGEQTRSLREHE